MHRSQLLKFADTLLDLQNFSDVSLNGLQVEGREDIRRIATAASATLEAIDAAVEQKADLLLVHHGLIWKGHPAPVCGVMKERLCALLESNLNLVAYHLPLDAHPDLGNNRCLCDILGMVEQEFVVPGDPRSIALRGKFTRRLSVRQVAMKLSRALDTEVMVLGHCDDELKLSGAVVCSGSGSFMLDGNPTPDFEALITGDVREQTYHLAVESATPVFVVGHHASEQEGVKRLGQYLAEKFEIEHVHLHFTPEKNVSTYDYELTVDTHWDDEEGEHSGS